MRVLFCLALCLMIAGAASAAVNPAAKTVVITDEVPATLSLSGDCIDISLPDTFFTNPGQTILVPVRIQDVTGWGIVAFDMEICWCDVPAGLLTFQSCLPGPVMLGSGWMSNCNPCSDNCVTVAGAGATPLAGQGVLFYLGFHVSANAKPCMCCDLNFTYVNLYDPENILNVCMYNGHICVEWCDILGCVHYWKCCEDECGETTWPFGLPGVEVHLENCDGPVATTFTSQLGCYEFTCLDPVRDDSCLYCVDLDYCDEMRRCITAYDAALILQYIVCLDPLDDCEFTSGGIPVFPQMVAADVSCNSVITSYDASLVLQYGVRLIQAFPCPDPWVWFPLRNPCIYTCPGIVDWIGVLKGDVSGCFDCGVMPLTEGDAVHVDLGAAVDLGDRFEVPVMVEGAYGILSSDMTFSFDNSDLYVISVAPAGLASGSMSAHNEAGGELAYAMANSSVYGGDGQVAVVTMGKMYSEADISSLTLTDVTFNNGDPPAELGGSAGVRDVSASTALGPAIPNPFRDGTTISYSLAVASDVNISIYSVTGQLVVTLADGWVESGEHTAWWSGVDRAGASVSKGVYFCKMRAAGYSGTTKIVLMD